LGHRGKSHAFVALDVVYQPFRNEHPAAFADALRVHREGKDAGAHLLVQVVKLG
jgi:hypothetical protein